eukprot:TRINITY_DN5559_c1_g1_i2.p1 TRINITY_DN5559_c1_g1~~TRINITY_DN5559_c1_g1_i2.p1  ORF type:complete len:596 (-),score=134.95 TRINITY_DN5559_c1_g1_i2:137-1870(-)
MWRQGWRAFGQLRFCARDAAWQSLRQRYPHRLPQHFSRSFDTPGSPKASYTVTAKSQGRSVDSTTSPTKAPTKTSQGSTSGAGNRSSSSSTGSGSTGRSTSGSSGGGDSSIARERSLREQHLRRILQDAAARENHKAAIDAVHRLLAMGAATTQDRIQQVHALLMADRSREAASALIALVKAGHQPEINLFHLVLRALTKRRGMMSDALVVFNLMRQCGRAPDTMACTFALRACSGIHATQHADQVLRAMAEAGVAADKHTFGAALNACCHSRDWQRALELFADMEAHHPDLVSVHMWNRLLSVLVITNQPQAAAAKAAVMAERGVPYDAVTYSYLLGASALLADSTKIDMLMSDMREAGLEVTLQCHEEIIRGYAAGGHVQLAEEALQAAVTSGYARPFLAMPLMKRCKSTQDVAGARRWLERLPSLGLATTPGMWLVAVQTAHEAGDADAADALWRDARAAGVASLYRAMRSIKTLEGRFLIVESDTPSPLQQPHNSALDLSRCTTAVAHVALREAARELRQMPSPAIRYIFTGAFSRKQGEIAEAAVEIMRDAGAQLSKEAGKGLWKATLLAQS